MQSSNVQMSQDIQQLADSKKRMRRNFFIIGGVVAIVVIVVVVIVVGLGLSGALSSRLTDLTTLIGVLSSLVDSVIQPWD